MATKKPAGLDRHKVVAALLARGDALVVTGLGSHVTENSWGSTFNVESMLVNQYLRVEYSFTPSPIPEPEIYAMMSIGFGLLGWVGRRRNLQVT